MMAAVMGPYPSRSPGWSSRPIRVDAAMVTWIAGRWPWARANRNPPAAVSVLPGGARSVAGGDIQPASPTPPPPPPSPSPSLPALAPVAAPVAAPVSSERSRAWRARSVRASARRWSAVRSSPPGWWVVLAVASRVVLISAAWSAGRNAHSSVMPCGCGVNTTRRRVSASGWASSSVIGSDRRWTARRSEDRNWVALWPGARARTAVSTAVAASGGRDPVASARAAVWPWVMSPARSDSSAAASRSHEFAG